MRDPVAEAVLIQVKGGLGINKIIHLDRFDLTTGMDKEINDRVLYRACGMNGNADLRTTIVFQVHDVSPVISGRQRLADDPMIDTCDGEIGIAGSRGEGELTNPGGATVKAGNGVIVLIGDGAIAGYAFTLAVEGLNGDQGRKAIHEVAAFGE